MRINNQDQDKIILLVVIVEDSCNRDKMVKENQEEKENAAEFEFR